MCFSHHRHCVPFHDIFAEKFNAVHHLQPVFFDNLWRKQLFDVVFIGILLLFTLVFVILPLKNLLGS